MTKGLLEKSRAIQGMLINISESPVDFPEMARVLADNLDCNVYIVGRRGQLVGYAFGEGSECTEMDEVLKSTDAYPETYNQDFLSIKETRANLIQPVDSCIFKPGNLKCRAGSTVATMIPVYGGAMRLGTMILTKAEGCFADEDIVLAEYGAIVVANEIMRMRAERTEEEARKKAAVQVAVATLSFSEKEAIEHIMNELKGYEGVLVASRIADEAGITRSVIVSALRKFESAGVIETRSLGMKGTYIKVLNDYLFEELRPVND